MTPHNPGVFDSFDSFWPSYRHHLCRELTQITVGDATGNAAVVGLSGWLAYTAYQHDSFFGAMAVGAVVLFLAHGVWSVLLSAAEATIAARPWYGVGRTVHHRVLGGCEVLDVTDHPETTTVWVLIQPREVEADAVWEPLSEVAG